MTHFICICIYTACILLVTKDAIQFVVDETDVFPTLRSVLQAVFSLNPASTFFRSFRCGFSGGPGLPPGLGHLVLDQLHHLHDHQTNSGSDASRCLRAAGRRQSLGGGPSTRPGPGRVSKVSLLALPRSLSVVSPLANFSFCHNISVLICFHVDICSGDLSFIATRGHHPADEL